MSRIDPPKGAVNIIDVLTEHGYEAYVVGGCVRDSVMGRVPMDWDITTDAYPEAVRGLFERSMDTGLRHGTVTVLIDKRPYEVTTFRIDGKYEDGRHPENVEFTRSLEDDLRRRDFTINSMAWSAKTGMVDPFGGMKDIERRVVRAVGDPSARFREDGLRMLRAVRFSARLGFDLEERTLEAISSNSSLIRKISGERIREELTGILTSDEPAKFKLLVDTGLMGEILDRFGYSFVHPGCLGGLEAVRADDMGALKGVGAVEADDMGVLGVLEAVEADTCLRWTMLLRCFAACDNFLASAEDILHKLKFSNENMKRILGLLRFADMEIGLEPGHIASAVFEVGKEIFGDLLKIKRGEALFHGKASGGHDRVEYIDRIQEVYDSLLASGCCMGLEDLAVNGRDLIHMGYSEGIVVGKALAYLLDRVLENSELNRKDILEKMALDFLHRSFDVTMKNN